MPEATLGLVSDCLSVLSAESDLSSFIKVFERLESSQLPQLLGLLQSKSSAELMQSLYCRLAEIEQLQPTVRVLDRSFVLRMLSLYSLEPITAMTYTMLTKVSF
jgi:hypothetical protein